MEKNPLTKILNGLADQSIPADVDYRAAVRAKVEASKTRSLKGVFSMKTGFAQPRRLAAAITLAVLLLAAGLLVTPQGRAWAQAAWRFFTQAEGDARLAPTLVSTLVQASNPASPLPTFTPQPMATLAFQEDCGSAQYPRCSLAQIQELVSFPVKQLGTLPEGWEWVGATGGPEQVLVLYRSLAGALELYQSRASAPDPFSWPVGGRAVIEPVTIGDANGEYVQGAWSSLGQNSGEVSWDGNVPERTLRWEAGGVRFTLRFLPAKTSEGSKPDRTMLAELASGLTLASANVIAPTPTPNTILAEVSAQAGFTAIEPVWLPERYELANAVYVPGRNAACLYYRYPESEGAPSLVIIESSWALALQDILLSPQFNNGQQIDIPVYTEYVAVGGALYDQALYASNGLDVNVLCNTKGVTSNHALLWQSGGKGYVISAMLDAFDGRGFLTQLEMRRIAESLTGVSTIPANALDPGYLPSVEAAESLAGFDIKAPTQMPAEMRFAYAIYRSANAPFMPIALAQGSPEVIQVYFSSTRDSIGRYHSFLFFQNTVAPNTLEELALGGGEWVTVNGLPAVYYQTCYDNSATGGDAACNLSLSWLDENGIRFDVEAYLPGLLAKEISLAIAESMH